MQPSVSIIIPVYNRADIVAETITSIRKQTLRNFECIIVDDGSTDGTFKVLQSLVEDDKRFIILQRPASKKKGAPSCRNIGVDYAKGETIMFFDSDDLMTPIHLEKKYTTLKKNKVDFVISKTVCFDHKNPEKIYPSALDKYFFSEYDTTLYNYATQKINWLTPDTLLMSRVAKQLYFNETLKRGQEYNFYCKLLVRKPSSCFIDESLTLRRMHTSSIRSSYTYEDILKDLNFLKLKTVEDIKDLIEAQTARELLSGVIVNTSKVSFEFERQYVVILTRLIFKFYGFKTTILYLKSHLSKFVFNRNYTYLKALRNHVKHFDQ